MLAKLKNNRGFTIIEVMIVLAIAGLIMLIVFLAVPALQRNAHNTSIKNDVSGLLAGMNEYTNNNNGKSPNGVSGATEDGIDIGASGSNVAHVKLGYIDGTTVTLSNDTAVSVTTSDGPGTIKLATGVKCDTDAVGTTTTDGATSRSYAAVYVLEGGALQCQES